jgi:dTDP-4-amino-4,6-dideoxygalactose transaminase
MLTTDDHNAADFLRLLRAHGAKTKYYHEFVGINSRLDALQAAILRVKLGYLDQWAGARRRNARTYQSLFQSIGLVSGEGVRLPYEATEGLHVYNQFVIRARDRDRLKSYLADHGIGTEIYYPLPLHLQECFRDLGHRSGDFPVAEQAAREALAIPVYPELTTDAQQYVVETINAFYRQAD